MPVLGGSLDGGGNPEDGYTLRGGRMLTTDNYECTWDLFKTIPSLSAPGRSVYEETIAFNEQNVAHSMARLVDRHRSKVEVKSMGFTMDDRLELLKLSEADEATLGTSRITDWLSPAFFTTSSWYMWYALRSAEPPGRDGAQDQGRGRRSGGPDTMTRGDAKPLYILPFDYPASFARGLFGWAAMGQE